LVASTRKSTTPTDIEVYRGTDLASLSLMGSETSSLPSGPRIVFEAMSGATYMIRVTPWYGGFTSGAIQLDIAEALPPANDSFSNAKTINALPYEDVTDSTFATKEAGEPDCGGVDDKTTWHKFQPATATDVQILSYACLYSGTELASLTSIPIGPSSVVRLSGGTTYYVQMFWTCCMDMRAVETQNVLRMRQVTPPTVTATLDKAATVTKAGSLRVSGSYSCTDGGGVVTSAALRIRITQAVGRLSQADGATSTGLTCDGQRRIWSATLTSGTSTPFWSGSATAQGAATLLGYTQPVTAPLNGTMTVKSVK
jgi:hypothetical protein